MTAAFDAGPVTSDAGALLLGATDRAIGMMKRFACCFDDLRRPDLIEHEVVTLVGQRVFGPRSVMKISMIMMKERHCLLDISFLTSKFPCKLMRRAPHGFNRGLYLGSTDLSKLDIERRRTLRQRDKVTRLR